MMRLQIHTGISLAAAGALLLALGTPLVHAQKIICWKDAAGKTVGCGDKVPAEYASGATKELDKQGNVRKTGESEDEATKRKAKEKEQAAIKLDETKRLTEQKRQDSALLNTFSTEKEIDLKRDRELLALNNFIIQQNAALKVANERLADARKKMADAEKDKKAAAPNVKDDLARAERDQTRITSDIAANEKAKADTMEKYAAYRKRYAELKGTTPELAPAPPAATAAAPAAPAKK
jgi:hypothetical protein